MDIKVTTTNVERVLDEFGREYVALLKRKLEADGRKASGKLIESLRTEIRAAGNSISVWLFSEDYLKYVDFGRRSGKYPPKEAIEEWVHDKGITPYPDKNGKLPTEKQLVYLIQRAIGENGTIKDLGYTGGGYTDSVIEELYPKYAPRLQEALQMDFAEYSQEIIASVRKVLTKI